MLGERILGIPTLKVQGCCPITDRLRCSKVEWAGGMSRMGKMG